MKKTMELVVPPSILSLIKHDEVFFMLDKLEEETPVIFLRVTFYKNSAIHDEIKIIFDPFSFRAFSDYVTEYLFTVPDTTSIFISDATKRIPAMSTFDITEKKS